MIDGDVGDDEITADDGRPDVLRCGAGTDRVRADRDGVDAAYDCGDPRPADPGAGPDPRAASAGDRA